MISPTLIADVQRDEGFREHAYPDPISGGKPWTVGFGSTGPDIGPDTAWTQEQAEADLVARLSRIESALTNALPWFAKLDEVRREALENMAYNLGVAGLLGFRNTLAQIAHGDYTAAAQGLLHSLWARQLPNRSARLARAIATGIHQD